MKLKTTLSVLLAIALTAMSAILVNARGVDPGGVKQVNEAWTMQDGPLPDCAVMPIENEMLSMAPALAVFCSREVRAGPTIVWFVRHCIDVDSAAAYGQVVQREAVMNTDFRAGIVSGFDKVMAFTDVVPKTRQEAVMITDFRAEDLFASTLASARANST